MRILTRLTTGTVFLAFFAISCNAGTFSFEGNFVNDNDVRLFNFTLAADNTVTFQTWGYGGGTNAQGNVISSGGFESILGVFEAPSGVAVGSPIFPGPDPVCGPRNPDPARNNFCQDAYSQVFLSAGDYILSLTQNANAPNGNLNDGFFFNTIVVDPAFNNNFVGSFGLQGDSHWAVDILSVDAASEVPEPGSAALVAAASLLAGICARRSQVRAKLPQ